MGHVRSDSKQIGRSQNISISRQGGVESTLEAGRCLPLTSSQNKKSAGTILVLPPMLVDPICASLTRPDWQNTRFFHNGKDFLESADPTDSKFGGRKLKELSASQQLNSGYSLPNEKIELPVSPVCNEDVVRVLILNVTVPVIVSACFTN